MSDKTRIEFIKEGPYGIHPAFGPEINVRIGEIRTFDNDIALQIVNHKWAKICEDQSEPSTGDDGSQVELPFPEQVLQDHQAGKILAEPAKDLLFKFAEEKLDIVFEKSYKQKSVQYLVDKLLLEIENQEGNDD
jgi:hypothetical protein